MTRKTNKAVRLTAADIQGAWVIMPTPSTPDASDWRSTHTVDLDETARRRGLPIESGRMEMVDGSLTTFRTAGMPRYPLPFFISFDFDPEARMRLRQARYREAGHDCGPGAFTFVEVGDTPEPLGAWLGDNGLPVRHEPGRLPGINAVGIETSRGEAAQLAVRLT